MPYLSPLSENGRPLSSVCSFCGGSAGIIHSLDCGNHFICDSCVRVRGFYSTCPLCANRDRHAIENSHVRRDLISERRNVNSHGIFPNLNTTPSVGLLARPKYPPPAAQTLVYTTSQLQGNSLSFDDRALPVYCNAVPYEPSQYPVSVNSPADPQSIGAQPLTSTSTTHLSSIYYSSPSQTSLQTSSHSIYDSGSTSLPIDIQQEIDEAFVALPVYDLCQSDPRFRSTSSRAVPVTHMNMEEDQYAVYSIPPIQETASFDLPPNQGVSKRPKNLFSRAFAKLNRFKSKKSPDSPKTLEPSNPSTYSGTYSAPYPALNGSVASEVQEPSTSMSASVYPSLDVFPPPLQRPSNLVLRRQKQDHLDEDAVRQFWSSK